MHQTKRNIVQIKHSRHEAKLSVIILAAGDMQKMKSYGPKSLIKLTPNKTLLQHQLESIGMSISGNYEIILVTGCQSYKLMNHAQHNIIQIENERYKNTNVVRSIGMGLRASTTERVLIIYGNTAFNSQCLKFPKKNKSCVVVNDATTTDNNHVGCIFDDKNDNLTYMFYDLPYIWSQITYLTGQELYLARKFCWNVKHEKKLGFELLNYIVDNRGHINSVSPNDMKYQFIKTPRDIIKARNTL